MIINGNHLLVAAPIKDMERTKIQQEHGVSYGLSEAGYDIRIKQEISFTKDAFGNLILRSWEDDNNNLTTIEQFVLASSIEEFQMPSNLVGIVHDKSTWARKGLSVFNTVIESGWNGWLTIELVYHGRDELVIPAGSGIAQVVFHETSSRMLYSGKYQNQANEPVQAKFV